MKNNILTIMKKELTRLFGDRRLVFSGIILQGLLLYVMYTLMGTFMSGMVSVDDDYKYKVSVVNMPEQISTILDEWYTVVEITHIEGANTESAKQQVANSAIDLLIVFSEGFDEAVTAFELSSGETAPQIQIWHNAGHIESLEADFMFKDFFREYERSIVKKFDVNAVLGAYEYDLNEGTDFAASLLMSMIPMMIIMVVYQGCMAIAPESISGEKERGTLGTLLATPAKRSHMALAKILSITVFGVLGSIVTFLGMMLSLPNMMGDGVNISFDFSPGEYLMIFAVTVSTVLVFVALLSIMSAYAKSIKEATSYASPFMLISIFCGMSAMFTGGAMSEVYYYLIPIFNSAQSLTSIFNGDISVVNITVTALTNVMFALIFTGILAKMFSSEKIVFDK